MHLDLSVFFWLNNLAGQNIWSDYFIIFLAEYLAYLFVIAFLIYLFYSSFALKKKIVLAFSAGIAGLVARYIFTSSIRHFWPRPRPFVTYHVHQLLIENGSSFPSGHASFFFAVSTVIYLYNKKTGWWFFLASFILSFARVAAGVHYPSDILAGMVVGIFSGWLIFKLYNKFFLRN